MVAVDLEKGGKGSWREIVSVVRGFSRFRPFPIRLEDGRRRRIDSLVFANIAEMAKYAKLSEAGARTTAGSRSSPSGRPASCGFWRRRSGRRPAGSDRSPAPPTTRFTTLAPMPLQLDGELVELDADTPVAVDIAPRALATIF